MTGEAGRLAKDALDRGDLLQAYDHACQGLENDSAVRFLKILALARMGESVEALQLYEQTNLYEFGSSDHKALKGRLLKDLGFDGAKISRAEALTEALEVYTLLFTQTGDYYPGINAATIARLLGRIGLSQRTASEVLQIPAVLNPTEYFAAVTKAEAQLLLGNLAAAGEAFRIAADAPGADWGSRSTTIRQLKRLAKALDLSADTLGGFISVLRPKAVAFYCGHIFIEDGTLEASLRSQLEATMNRADVGLGYGALAAGADILIAEALLERSAELHVVLPFAEADFIKASVAVAGFGWMARYSRCKAAATTFVEATTMGYVGDPQQFSHGSTIAMGLAKLRARHLDSDVLQLAIWDGASPGAAGTGADVAKWKRGGGRTEVIPSGAYERPSPSVQAVTQDQNRKSRAIIFADLPGFTKIPENLLPSFWEHVMGTASRVLDNFKTDLENTNTWGDALYLVFRSANSAAAAMLELQGELEAIDYRSLGFSAPPTFRIAGHFAPVYVGRDPITDRPSVYGVEVSKAARIEPITPAGSIYVTASFAAQLEMEAPGTFDPLYVGKVPLAKAYGHVPVYRLKRRGCN